MRKGSSRITASKEGCFDQMLWHSSGCEEGQSIWSKRRQGRQGFQPCFEAGIRELPFAYRVELPCNCIVLQCNVHLLNTNSHTTAEYNVLLSTVVLGFKSHFTIQSLSGFEYWDSRFSLCHIELSFPTPRCTSDTRRWVASMCTHNQNHNSTTARTPSIIFLP